MSGAGVVGSPKLVRAHGLRVRPPHVPHVRPHVTAGAGPGDSAPPVRTGLSPLWTGSGLGVGVVRPHAGQITGQVVSSGSTHSSQAAQAARAVQAGPGAAHISLSRW